LVAKTRLAITGNCFVLHSVLRPPSFLPSSDDGQAAFLGGLGKPFAYERHGLFQVLGRSGMDLKDNHTDLAFGTGHRRERGRGALKKQMLPECRRLGDSP
jgi:hypothetical protein